MRIPEDRFDDALDRVDGLGERLSLNVSSQDVTEEYVDIEARLKVKKEIEARYTALLAQATTVADVLVVGGGLAGCEASWQMAEAGIWNWTRG